MRLLGSVELTAVGVSASVFNLVSKLINVPLLNITTSFVAEEQGLVGKAKDNSRQIGDDFQGENQSKKFLPSASTSLALSASIGIAEAVALFLCSSVLMDAMGFTNASPAEQFLSLRAFGAPPIVISLAAQGTFRGFKNTKIPLYAICAGNLLDAVLDGILIFILKSVHDVSELEQKLAEQSKTLSSLQLKVDDLASKHAYNPNEEYEEVESRLRLRLESFLETAKSFNMIYTKLTKYEFSSDFQPIQKRKKGSESTWLDKKDYIISLLQYGFE